MSLAVLVEIDQLVATVIASVVAGVGITTIFSFAIWGAAAYVDYSADGRRVAAFFAALVGIVAFLATLATAGFGLLVMTSK